MTQSLFRPEVIEYQRRRLWGEVIVVVPTTHKLFALLLSFIACSSGLFLLTVSYARTETVQGFITVSGGQSQVYASRGGIISEVFVREGDFVVKNQPLVALTLETETAGGPVAARAIVESKHRLDEIEAQMASAELKFDSDRRRLAMKREGLRAELASLGLRMTAERSLLSLQQSDLAKYAHLAASGYAPQIELSRRKQQTLAQEGTVRELERQLRSRETDLADADAQEAALPLEKSDRISQLRNARSELIQTAARLEADQGYTISAPVEGQITALQGDVGQMPSRAAPIVAIAPVSNNIEAQLLVPTRASGMITVGQDVSLRIEAFPFQRFGAVAGKITQISKAVFKPGEILVPIPHQEAAYRVVVVLERQAVEAYGQARALVPGMTLVADVITDRRKFLDWVLDPLRAASARAK